MFIPIEYIEEFDQEIDHTNLYFLVDEDSGQFILNFQKYKNNKLVAKNYLFEADGSYSFELETFLNDFKNCLNTLKDKSAIAAFVFRYTRIKLPFIYDSLTACKAALYIKIRPNTKALMKLIKYIFLEPVSLEKLIKTGGEKVLLSDLVSDKELLCDKGKFHKTIGLSKPAINLMTKLKLEECLMALQNLSAINENYVITLLDFIGSYKTFMRKFKSRQGVEPYEVSRFIEDLIFLLNNNYKLQPTLNYITKQTLLYGNSSIEKVDNISDRFKFPKDTLQTLADYVSMCNKMNVKNYERYPAYLTKAHNVYVSNFKLFKDPDLANKFIEDAKTKTYLNVIGEEYSFVVPQTVEDLAVEGNTLHHCVGTYGREIVEKGVIVVFFRANNKLNTPFVTVELSYNDKTRKYKPIQAKGAFHEDPPEDILEKINELAKKIKKK